MIIKRINLVLILFLFAITFNSPHNASLGNALQGSISFLLDTHKETHKTCLAIGGHRGALNDFD